MALQHRLSDAVAMRIDHDPQTGHAVIEIEFRYVRYRLVTDDDGATKKLRDLINLILSPVKGEQEKISYPRFYKDKRSIEP